MTRGIKPNTHTVTRKSREGLLERDCTSFFSKDKTVARGRVFFQQTPRSIVGAPCTEHRGRPNTTAGHRHETRNQTHFAWRGAGKRQRDMATPLGTGPIVQDVAPKGGFPKVRKPSVARTISPSPLRNTNYLHTPASRTRTDKRITLLVCGGCALSSPVALLLSLLPKSDRSLMIVLLYVCNRMYKQTY